MNRKPRPRLSNPITFLDVVTAQIELLENINLRIAELEQWKQQYPQHREACESLRQQGLQVGLTIKNIGAEAEVPANLDEVVRQHNSFILSYEKQWGRMHSPIKCRVSLFDQGQTWVVVQDGQSNQTFATQEGAWAYLAGISWAEAVEVAVYDLQGSLLKVVTMNAAVSVK
jgi:hypothetical protein